MFGSQANRKALFESYSSTVLGRFVTAVGSIGDHATQQPSPPGHLPVRERVMLQLQSTAKARVNQRVVGSPHALQQGAPQRHCERTLAFSGTSFAKQQRGSSSLYFTA